MIWNTNRFILIFFSQLTTDDSPLTTKKIFVVNKNYIDKDLDLSLLFVQIALQRYADGFGYEPEYTDVEKCYDIVCVAAVNGGKKDEATQNDSETY